jgi:hypothetical protein
VLAGWLAWRSVSWPLVHDAPLMHYIAWLWRLGAVPYRDAFDMNFPGVYLIHRAVLAAGGAGDLAWRLFDLGWLLATCALLWAYCRPVAGWLGGAWAALLFACYHLAGGAWRAGQRDFLLGLFLLAGALAVARWAERGSLAALLGAGLALGAGMTVKPHAGLFWLGCAALAAWTGRRSGRSAAAAGTVLGAGLAAPAALFGWLGFQGGLRPFLEILTGYVLPLYSQVGRVPAWQALSWHRYGWALWGLLAALGLLALLAPTPPEVSMRKWIAAVGAAYGLIHFALQGKGWEYQLYPAALFLSALAAVAVSAAPARGAPAAGRPVALALSAALVLVLGLKGAEAVDAPWIAEKARRVAAVERDLKPLVPPGATVQVLDVTEGGIHALLRLGLRQPTRFIYDFHFFHHAADPRIQALREEFARGFEAGRPAAVVVFRDTWNHPGYGRLDELGRVAALLARDYRLAVEGDGYRIYAKRSGP